jgi:hypothetical protein
MAQGNDTAEPGTSLEEFMPVDEIPPVAPAKPHSLGSVPAPVYLNGVRTATAFEPQPKPMPASPTLQERVTWYGAAALVTIAVLFAGMRLDAVHLNVPLTYGGGSGAIDSINGTSLLVPDVLLIMPMIKATLEGGTHWRNARMGYPGVQELNDFPVIDHLHLFLIWCLGQIDLSPLWCLLLIPAAQPLWRGLGYLVPQVRAVPPRTVTLAATLVAITGFGIWHFAAGPDYQRYLDYVEIFNLYYLGTYPLTTLTAMYAFRRLGISLPMAAVGGLLYAFLPYHYLRGQAHYFLSAYWLVPLSWLPALAACQGQLPFFQRDESAGYRLSLRRWDTLWQVLLAAATASAGAYYAFFACAIYAFVGLYQWIVLRTWRAAASMAAIAILVAAFGVINHIPAIVYSAKYERNTVTERTPGEAEVYGLKIAHLILPLDLHNFTEFGRIKNRYNAADRPLQNEQTCATLGLIGSVGFLGLLGLVFFPKARGWPYGPLSALTWFMFLYGTIGGLSSIFNLLVFDQIRCPNRISVYLAFICLFAVLLPVDRFLLTRSGRARKWRYPALAGLALFGIVDQTPTPWFTDRMVRILRADASRFRADKQFFTRVEEMMPEGAKIFCMPYMPFPEEPPLHDMNTYEHARGFLHTNTLVWSYGTMKHREVDAWQENLYHGQRDQILRRLAARGFDGIFLDKRGYMFDREHGGDQGDKMIADLKASAGRVKLPVIEHSDHRQAFVDIRPYRDWLQAEVPLLFEKWAREEREFVAITWINGFLSTESYGLRDNHRWGYTKGTAVIVNPSDRVRKFRLAATFGVDTGGDFTIRIDGSSITQVNRPGGAGPWTDQFLIETELFPGPPPYRRLLTAKEYILEIPPGRHTVKFRCATPYHYMPADPRPLSYYLTEIQFSEVK